MYLDLEKWVKDLGKTGMDMLSGIVKESQDIAFKTVLGENYKPKENEPEGKRKGRYSPFSDEPEDLSNIPKYLLKNKKRGFPFAETSSFPSRKLYLPKNDWVHLVAIGATGLGKTTWAENYVVNCPHGCAFIDNADGNAINNILRALPKERLEKTVVLDHSDKHYPLGVGVVSEVQDVFESDMITSQWVDFFIYGFDIGDKFRTQELIANACKTVFSVKNATVLDAVRVVTDSSFRNYALSNLNREMYGDVLDFWDRFDNMSSKQQAQHSQAFLHRAGVVFRDTYLKLTLGQIPKKKLDYKKWMNEGWTILIKIPEDELDKQEVRIIASLHIIGMWDGAMSRKKDSPNIPPLFTIVADEPQNWLSKNAQTLDNIFSKARKYGLKFMPLFQSTEQVRQESSELLKIIFDNQPDVISFSETEIPKFRRVNWKDVDEFNFVGSFRNSELFKAKAMKPAEPKRDWKAVGEIFKKNRDMYNRYYKEVNREIKGRLRKWEDSQNIKESQSEFAENGLIQKSNHESPKEMKTSSDSSIRID